MRVLVLPVESSQAIPTEAQPSAVQAYALALRGQATGAKAPRFNLRRGEFAFKGDFDYVKDRMGLLASFAATVLLLLIASGVVRNSVLARREAQVDAVLCKTTERILGRCEKDYRPRAQHAAGRGEPRRRAAQELTAVNLLAEVTARVPSDVPVKLDRIQVELERIILQGETKSSKEIDTLTQGLREHRCFKEVNQGKVEKTRDGQKVTFRLDIQVQLPRAACWGGDLNHGSTHHGYSRRAGTRSAPREQRLLMVAGGAVVVFILFITLFSFSTSATKYRTRTQDKLAKLAQVQELAASYNQATAARSAIEAQLTGNDVSLLTYISDKATAAGLEAPNMTPKGEQGIGDGKILESTMELHLHGRGPAQADRVPPHGGERPWHRQGEVPAHRAAPGHGHPDGVDHRRNLPDQAAGRQPERRSPLARTMATQTKTSRWKIFLGYAAFALVALIALLAAHLPVRRAARAHRHRGAEVGQRGAHRHAAARLHRADGQERAHQPAARAAQRGHARGPGEWRPGRREMLGPAELGEPWWWTRCSCAPPCSLRALAFRAELMGGEARGSFGGLKNTSLLVRLENLDPSKGNLKNFTGLDLEGRLSGSLALTMPPAAAGAGIKAGEPDLSQADGELALDGRTCSSRAAWWARAWRARGLSPRPSRAACRPFRWAMCRGSSASRRARARWRPSRSRAIRWRCGPPAR